MKGKITTTWKDENNAYVALSVEEAKDKFVEYNGSAPLLDGEGNAKDDETLAAEAIEAAKSLRLRQIANEWKPKVPKTVEL